MTAGSTTSGDALLERADRAIADAIATRAEIRAGLAEAAGRMPCRPPRRVALQRPKHPEPLPWGHLDPWCALARAMACADEIVRETDAELERAWREVLPTIETPLALVRE